MTHCLFQPTGPDQYRCDFCGFQIHSPHSPGQIRRNCPRSPPALARTVAELRRDLAARVAQGVARRSWEEVARLVERCARCEQLSARGCRRFRGCDAREKWLSLFTAGRCPQW
jgi:hypothetical protein